MKNVVKFAPLASPILLLALFVVIWTVYPSYSRLNLEQDGDMLENYSWGIAWQAGYFKHPPLFAWITASWFTIFPHANWAYYLLSALNAALAVFASWRIATRFLDPWRAFLSVALFFFLPPVTFLAIKYNANAAMLPLWPLTVLFYIRFLEGRKMLDAVLCGLLAAASVLVKYYSGLLVAAIGLHIVLDRDVRPVLTTRGFWIAGALFVAALAPHIRWLFQNDFLPVTYAAAQGDGSRLTSLVSIPEFLGAMLLYALPAVLVLLLVLQRNQATAILDLRAFRGLRRKPVGRALLSTTFVPIVLVVLLAASFAAELSSVWALPMFFSVPILLLLLVPEGQLEVHRAVMPAVVLVYCAVLLAALPVIRMVMYPDAELRRTVPVRSIALAIDKAWSAHTNAPLSVVAGNSLLANGASFYAPSRPYSIQENSLALTPWITREDIEQKGMIVACLVEEPSCEQTAQNLSDSYDGQEEVSIPGFVPEREWVVRLFIALPARETARAEHVSD